MIRMFRTGMAWLFVSVGLPLQGQEGARAYQLAVGAGPLLRATGADGERHLGVLGQLIIRGTNAPVAPRFALGIAHFGSSSDIEGRLCNPDGPCYYYAPRITVLSEAVGAEWRHGTAKLRGMFAIAAYQVVSPPVQGPSTNDPGARRGVRRTGGIQAGLIAPLKSRAEIELRYEWLARSIESTRYFLPVTVRFHW